MPNTAAAVSAHRGSGEEREPLEMLATSPKDIKGTAGNRAGDEEFAEFLRHVKVVHKAYDPEATFPNKVKYFRRAYYIDKFFHSMIVAYFVFKCVEAQHGPSHESDILEAIEFMFEVIFIVDVFTALVASWFFPFWKRFWNVFDFVTVSLTVLDFMGLIDGRGWIFLRIFRVFDALKRHKDFKILTIATFDSMKKAGFLFLGVFMLMSIYSVIGVKFFGDTGDEMLDERFGTYDKAMFTMLQVLTGDSWSSVVARTAMSARYWFAYAFFMSYVIILGIVLMNVVQAVFLDAYLNAHSQASHRIEVKKMKMLFDDFDTDNTGEISKQEVQDMCDMLNRFGFKSNPDDMFSRIDRSSAHNILTSDGSISFEEFMNAKKKTEELDKMTLEKLDARIELVEANWNDQLKKLTMLLESRVFAGGESFATD